MAGEEYLVKSDGEDAGIDCTYKFTGDVKDNCMGLCYALQTESYFENLKANVKLVIGGHTTVCCFFPFFLVLHSH